MRKKLGFTAAILASVIYTSGALAHPHVFAQARLELEASSDGSVVELRHVWRFDDLFTSTVILEFDANTNGELDDDELDTVTNTIAGSIVDFNYFQNIEVQGKNVPVNKVEEMTVAVEDGQLILIFATVPSTPIKLADNPKIGIFDPTFYTAIEFYSKSDMVLLNAPEGCTHEMVIPDPDEAIAQNEQSLTEAFYETNAENDMSKIFATRMEVSCQ